jgi:excisionase family DNA binding protein
MRRAPLDIDCAYRQEHSGDGADRNHFSAASEVPMPSEFTQPTDPSTMPKKPPMSAAAPFPERLLDSDEAASIMKVHPKTLQKLARKGVVRGVHIGKLWRFRASTIEEWIQRQLAS